MLYAHMNIVFIMLTDYCLALCEQMEMPLVDDT